MTERGIMRKYMTKVNVGFVLLVMSMMSSLQVGFWAYLVGIPAYILLAPRLWNDMNEMAEQQAALMGIDLKPRK